MRQGLFVVACSRSKTMLDYPIAKTVLCALSKRYNHTHGAAYLYPLRVACQRKCYPHSFHIFPILGYGVEPALRLMCARISDQLSEAVVPQSCECPLERLGDPVCRLSLGPAPAKYSLSQGHQYDPDELHAPYTFCHTLKLALNVLSASPI